MRRNRILLQLVLGVAIASGATNANTLRELNDEALSKVQGAGLAFPFDEFRFEMAPTSYIELIGDDTNPADTTFIRGDLRYYGMSMTRATEGGVLQTSGVDWQGNACSGGFRGLGCPMHEGFVENFSTYDNPYVWRAFNYTGHEPDSDGTQTNDRAVFEILGPSNMDTFRWAFWGEIESGRTYNAVNNGLATISGASCGAGAGSDCLTQLQNIIIGKPTALGKPRSIFGEVDNPDLGPALRFFQYAGTTGETGDNPATYGLQYLSRLSGDYRLSVNTSSNNAPQRGVVPDFTNEEGLYFTDVQAYLALGQLHYQALVFDNAQPGSTNVGNQDGNIVIEVTRIPNVVAVYNDFYSLAPGDTLGYQRTNRPDRYYETHGYVEWGNGFPINSNPNGMGGTGVSQIRFAGMGLEPDGPTRSVNSANFPAATCASNGGGVSGSNGSNCTSWRTGDTVGDIFDANHSDPIFRTGYTKEDVVNEDGIAFVASEGGSWEVLHNQNRQQQENMLWVCRSAGGSQGDCGSSGSNWADTVRLERDSRYTATPNGNGDMYNPMLTMEAINLGTARVEGLQINHLKIETLGGGN